MEEDLAGEGVVAGMQRLELAQQLEYLGVAGQPVEQDPPGGGGVLGCGPRGSHTQTVGQNRSAHLRSSAAGEAAGPLGSLCRLRMGCLTCVNRLIWPLGARAG